MKRFGARRAPPPPPLPPPPVGAPPSPWHGGAPLAHRQLGEPLPAPPLAGPLARQSHAGAPLLAPSLHAGYEPHVSDAARAAREPPPGTRRRRQRSSHRASRGSTPPPPPPGTAWSCPRRRRTQRCPTR
eukprot:scaffold285103_cov23-Tisochrysis_lutea.AAC.4